MRLVRERPTASIANSARARSARLLAVASVLGGFVAGCAGSSSARAPAQRSETRASFFETPRRGTNFFNAVETRERFHAAAVQGIRLVRLVPDKWQGAERDFLIGSADRFAGLVPADLARLRATLDDAAAEGVKVVLGLLSLPGARWKQNNDDRSDFRLYRDPAYQDQAVDVWRRLASELKGHPAVIGYNLLNEPHPERSEETATFDLSAFYRRAVSAIRESDSEIAVIVDAGDFASPAAFDRLVPLDDARVLYAFHMYEPWPYVNHVNKGRYRYPGDIPVDDGSSEKTHWDKRQLERALEPVATWQAKHAMPPNRIFAEEFGCPRTHPGVEKWIGDLIDIFNSRGWHWAFYSFREDTWDAMDYELGTTPPPAQYWEDLEAGKQPELPRVDNAIWRVISAQFHDDVDAGYRTAVRLLR